MRKYRKYQAQEFFKIGIPQQINGYVFTQYDGAAMHPDSVTDYLNKFSKKYDLPHINAHAFRHTMAIMLYFNGVDSVSISKAPRTRTSFHNGKYLCSHYGGSRPKKRRYFIGYIS